MRHSITFIFLFGFFGAAQSALAADCAAKQVDPAVAVSGWGVNAQNHRFIAESSAGITPDNINRLKLQWVFGLPDTDAPRFVPLVSADTVIISDDEGIVYALDRSSGCEKWRFEVGGTVRTAFRYMEIEGEHRLYFGNMDGELIMLDLLSGSLIWRADLSDHPRAMLSGSGIEHEGVIYQPVSSWEVFWALNPFYACCTFRGSLVAVDAVTGKIRWRSYVIEQEAEVVKSRWLLPDYLGPSGAPVWSQPTLDVERRRVYVGTGENYSAPATDTSDAILAFDMDSGEMIWKQQFLAGDIWNISCEFPLHVNCPVEAGEDLDFGAPPILVSDGDKDIILAGQKSGQVFALDPDKGGELLWTQRAGGGGKAGGIHFGMAVDPDRGVLYVPISDRSVAPMADSAEGELDPSLHAFQIASGEPIWRTAAPGSCIAPDSDGEELIDGCLPGFSAAITVTERLVFAPTLDGYLRAFDARNGQQVWSFDTTKTFPSVSESDAQGGAIDYGGVVLEGGQLFVSSGYGLFGQIPGNAFMVFAVEPAKP